MSEEFIALTAINTWSLVLCPSNKSIICNKWVFHIKRHHDGSMARYKAHLVAKGFTQKHGLDYSKAATVCMSLAVQLNWSMRQVDNSNAFLYGTIDEDVFMAQPLGFVDKEWPSYVCKLHKTLYGLKNKH